jgi:hypothetical protein
VGVGGVGLAALAGGEHPRPRRELGWDIDDLLTVAEQSQRDVPTNAGQPSAHTPLGHCLPYLSTAAYPSRSVAKRPPPRTVASAAMTSIVTERLCGSIPMTTRSAAAATAGSIPVLPMLDPHLVVEPGGQRYFEQNKPLLSLSPPLGGAQNCAGQMRATRPAWAAEVRATAQAPKPSLARHRS